MIEINFLKKEEQITVYYRMEGATRSLVFKNAQYTLGRYQITIFSKGVIVLLVPTSQTIIYIK
jgi:hypothetical protein